jgi:hypothetical protein
MSIVKSIRVKTITSRVANDFVKNNHYSGKVVSNSQLHFGAFLNGVLHGVMQFGPSMDKSKIQGLVLGTGWNDFIELNRMAFDNKLPKNSESRCLSIAIRLIKKEAPHIKWIISFADATQCGDGTIYRASGFLLTGIKINKQILRFPDGLTETRMLLSDVSRPSRRNELAARYGIKLSGKSTVQPFLDFGAKYLDGYQLRYIYFIDKSKYNDLTVEVLPFSAIGEMGAKMYKGERQKYSSDTTNIQLEEDGAEPILTHQEIAVITGINQVSNG